MEETTETTKAEPKLVTMPALRVVDPMRMMPARYYAEKDTEVGHPAHLIPASLMLRVGPYGLGHWGRDENITGEWGWLSPDVMMNWVLDSSPGHAFGRLMAHELMGALVHLPSGVLVARCVGNNLHLTAVEQAVEKDAALAAALKTAEPAAIIPAAGASMALAEFTRAHNQTLKANAWLVNEGTGERLPIYGDHEGYVLEDSEDKRFEIPWDELEPATRTWRVRYYAHVPAEVEVEAKTREEAEELAAEEDLAEHADFGWLEWQWDDTEEVE